MTVALLVFNRIVRATYPLTPSLSPTGGEGRGEGADRPEGFMYAQCSGRSLLGPRASLERADIDLAVAFHCSDQGRIGGGGGGSFQRQTG